MLSLTRLHFLFDFWTKGDSQVEGCCNGISLGKVPDVSVVLWQDNAGEVQVLSTGSDSGSPACFLLVEDAVRFPDIFLPTIVSRRKNSILKKGHLDRY